MVPLKIIFVTWQALKGVPNIIITEYYIDLHHNKNCMLGFPGSAVVKHPPANAGDMGSSPGLGRSHMLWSN